MTPEEQVIRDWLDGMLSPSGSPLPPSRRRSQPIPRRQVTAVIATLIGLLDEARGVHDDDQEPPRPLGTFEWMDFPVVNGFAHLPGGQIIESGSAVVRLPVVPCPRCGQKLHPSWADMNGHNATCPGIRCEHQAVGWCGSCDALEERGALA